MKELLRFISKYRLYFMYDFICGVLIIAMIITAAYLVVITV